MTIVIDTAVLIDHLRGNDAARQALRAAADTGARLACSLVTKVEVLAGMRASEEGATRGLFGVVEWVGVGDEIAEHAGRLANRYLRSHPGVDPVDYIIAATAAQLDARLWTRNLKRFPMFPGLAAPY